MKRILFLICGIIMYMCGCGQEDSTLHKIMFYNVENLFHPSDDSLTADDDFTPTGSYHWTYKKYFKKVSMVGKVIVAAGGSQGFMLPFSTKEIRVPVCPL